MSFFQSHNKCFISEFFSFWSNPIQSCLYISCLFEASIDNLESGKSLEFWVQKTKQTLLCLFYFIILFLDRLFTILWILILAGFLQVCAQAAQSHVMRRSLVINSDNQRLGSMGELWIDGQNAVAQTLCFM